MTERFTVGDMRRQLEIWDDDDELQLPGGLSFYRLKKRGDSLVVIEVNEPEAYLNPKFKKKNPHIKVAYVHDKPLAEGEVIAPVNVDIS